MPFSSFPCEENGSVTQLNFNNLISQTARATIASCISVSGHRRRCHSQLWVYVSLYGGRLGRGTGLISGAVASSAEVK
ncbi:hypothetical protein CDAR_567781 [Caerostris darwini]|uniref:Uncharacterized protein n=1 Tax=Caerostris darwini TaxID=1538125 RepID=A0AAV4RUJ2_9ARAC|nr:hypothetical protein CDAR_567781 [Caerostris darwini]